MKEEKKKNKNGREDKKQKTLSKRRMRWLCVGYEDCM